MKNSYINRTISLALLVGALSFSCPNKPKEINLENKIIDSTEIIQETKDTAVYHIIEKGDTYLKLAEIYWGTIQEADEIKKLNPGVDYKKLKIGQKIRVK